MESGGLDAAAEALEEAGSLGPAGETGDVSGVRRHVPMQVFLPRKKAIQLDELRLRRMKKGFDHSRSRLVCEAIDLLAARESGGKNSGKDE